MATITHQQFVAIIEGEKGQALARHAFAYKAKLEDGTGSSFWTAWTTYGMMCSDHEELLHDLTNAIYGDGDNDWLELLPNIVFWLLLKHGKSDADRESAFKFLADACQDLIECHLRESASERESDGDSASLRALNVA